MKTTTYRPNGSRRIEEELIVRTRQPPRPLLRPRSPSRSPSPMPALRNSRFPHSFYGENPSRRRSFERIRSTIRRSSSTVRFVEEETPRAVRRNRSPTPVRGVWEEASSSEESSHRTRRRHRSSGPPRLRLRSRSRSRTQSRRPGRSRSRSDADGFIRGALAASVTALSIRGARNLLDRSGRQRSHSGSRRTSRSRSRRRNRSVSDGRYMMSGGRGC